MRMRIKSYPVAILWLMSAGYAGCLLPAYDEDPPTECSQGLNSWGHSYQGASEEAVLAMSADTQGNLITVGTYIGETQFGAQVFTNENGFSNGFILKHDKNGSLQWAVSISNEEPIIASHVDTAPDGRVLVAGTYHGELSLGGNPTKQDGSPMQNIFLAEYGLFGEPQWNEGLKPNEIDDSPSTSKIEELTLYDIGYDNDLNRVICGTFRFMLDVGDPNQHLFLLKLGPDGNQKSAQRYYVPLKSATDGYVEPSAIGFDSQNNIYISGAYGGGTLTFSEQVQLPFTESDRLFFAKLAPDGTPISARVYDSETESDQNARDFIIDKDDNKYVLASNFGTFTAIPDQHLEANGTEQVILIKQDANDNIVWVKGFGGAGEDRGERLALAGPENPGKLILAGTTTGDILFEKNLVSAGKRDIFLAFINTSNGEPTFSAIFGDTSDQGVSGLAVGAASKPYIAGEFSGSLDFGINPVQFVGATEDNPNELFFAKPCQ